MPGARKKGSHNNDVAIDFAVQGFSKAILARLFELDRATVQKYLKGVPSDGERNGYPIYKIARVAPILLKVKGPDVESNVNDPSKMKPGDRKDYWQARQAEQKAMEAAGDLWHTEQVIDLISQSFKHIKLSIQLFTDIVERETTLTSEQATTLQQLADNLLVDMRERLLNDLVDPEEEDGEIRKAS